MASTSLALYTSMLCAFDTAHQVAFCAAFALAAAAIVQQARDKCLWAIGLLTLAAAVLRIVAATLDPFLNDWDEAYHAVVAKNLMAHPFTPMLFRQPGLPITENWSEQHIWLHKPPFFLWQIALSLKVFGLHPWAVRIPSVLWTTAMVPLVWRMGILIRSERTGFIAAALTTCSFLLQELTAGTVNTDHNDTVFIATIACACWAWCEYLERRATGWALAAGAFSACAVLTKWHVGGILFLPWGLFVLQERFSRSSVKGALAGVLALALPVAAWLLHITRWFPKEAAHEWGFKARHFTIAMDGHSGSAWFHFDTIAELLPPFTWWLVLPACGWCAWRCARAAHRFLLIAPILCVHVFFALAATKMVCYTLVLLPVYFLGLGCALDDLLEQVPRTRLRQPVFVGTTALLCWFGLGMARIQATHTLLETPLADRRWRLQNLASAHALADLDRIASTYQRPVIFNVPRNHHLRFGFAYGTEAWAKPPTHDEAERLRRKGYTVLVLQDGLDPSTFPPGIVLVPDSAVRIDHDVRM